MKFLSGDKVLVLISERSRKSAAEAYYLGYTIDMDGYFIAPSLMVYAKAEWAEGNGNVSWTYERATREGISVL